MHQPFGRRYGAVRELGAGAQGSVTLVSDRYLGGRLLALKTLAPRADAGWLSLFKREFEVLAQLRHPRLARVHDFGALDDGRAYFTRDFVPGDDLHARTAGVSATQLVAIAVEACRALSPLHSSGLVHGDLKPGNIIVDKGGRVHLIDFSFVRATDSGTAPAGTLPYMAPEVIEEGAADVRADLYSLGAVLFEAASGEPLFEGTAREIAAGHLGDERPEPRPDRLAPRGEDPAIWRGLRAVISRLVARRPEERFPSVEEVRAALTALAPSAVSGNSGAEIPALPTSAGREAETRRVREAVLARLTEPQGRGAVVAVAGEAGTGKSAILSDVKWCAQLMGLRAIEVACGGGGIVGPIVALAEQLSDLHAGDTQDAALADALVGELKGVAAGRADLDALALRFGRIAARAAQAAPLLVLVDDVDRASDETAALLRGLCAGAEDRARMALLLSCRAGFPWRDRLGRGEEFALPLLDRAAVGQLAAAYFGAVSDDKIARILAHTGGNPLFVGSLLRDLANSGGGLEVLERLGPPVELGAYWRGRLEALAQEERRALEALAVLGASADAASVARVAGIPREEIARIADRLEAAGLVRTDGGSLFVGWGSLVAEILAAADGATIALLHRGAVEVEAEPWRRLLHAALAGETAAVGGRWAEIAAGLERAGALTAARELLFAVARALRDTDEAAQVHLALGRVSLSQGDHAAAARFLAPLADEPGRLGMEALALLGKMHGARRELPQAAHALVRALERATVPAETARILADLAGVQFRSGELAEAVRAARSGLDHAPPNDAIRAELLGVLGKAAATRGDHAEAASFCEAAVSEARACVDRRSLAPALDNLAWVREQAGDLCGAAEALSSALALHREMGDLRRLMRAQLVAGDVDTWLERRSEALSHYEEAMRLASAVGNPVQGVEVQVGLGQALAKVGRFERAALLLAQAREDASRLGQGRLRAYATAYSGDIAAWQGRAEEALALWSEARDALEQVGLGGVCAELEIEMADLRLTRGGAGDLDAARLLADGAEARAREDRGRGFEETLSFVRGAIAIAEGRFEEGLRRLDELARALEANGHEELLWQVHAAAARALLDRGSEVLARQRLRKAERILERIADALPAEHRLSFWQDVRRAEIRRLLAVTVPSSSRSLASGGGFDPKADELDPEAAALYRVLECNKRLASETAHDHLLESILDASIELTQAERGFVLLRCEGGLEVGAAREFGKSEPRDPGEQFSRSIAESVCLDGEPVVTVDAAGDDRFNEFLSIHALKIKSVACVPVSYRGASFGVLYLENRLRRGRFGARDLRVLTAFADQVAIAIAHTRLLEEARRREKDLSATTAALEEMCARQAADIDSGRTSLRLVEERLERARQRLEGQGDYHGIVGTGEAMRRVFEVMERVRDLELPLVVVGESGTGKDLVARVLHDTGSRRSGPFVTLSCGGIPESLLEATLFGHGKGAFSGADRESPGLLAAAAGGTLYVDDLGEMPPRLQVDLLRVLQEGTYVPLGKSEPQRAQCRFIASAREPLDALVARGRLRQDLYYRLDVVAIPLPALRERPEDIPILARSLLRREAERLGRSDPGLEAAAVNALAAHSWPGNVREMEQLLRRALVIDDGPGPLTTVRLFGVPTAPIDAVSASPELRKGKAEEAERRQLIAALEACKWNKSLAAEHLDMPRRTFYRRLEKFGLLKRP
jgi:serine/threonine-protein kinase PknK